MPRRSTSYGEPRQWLVDGNWPTGTFDHEAPDVVAYAVQVSVLLEQALTGMNKSQVAQDAGVDRGTLYGLLRGTTWADMITLGKLEVVLKTSLWPASPPALRRKAGP